MNRTLPIARLLVLAGSTVALLAGCSSTPGGGTPAPISGRAQTKRIPREVLFKQARETFAAISNKAPVVTGTPEALMVRRVGERIRDATAEHFAEEGEADRLDGFDWRFVLVDEPRMQNAFALPGGQVVVFSGMLPITRDENGLAAVMGHEIAHAVLEHANERLSRRYQLSGMFSGKAHSRLQEKEADEVGMLLMARAGYDPAACKALWRRMNEARRGREVPYFDSTHPADAQRIHNLGRLEADVRPVFEQSVRRGYTFEQFGPEFAALDHFAGLRKGHNAGFTQMLATIDFLERWARNPDPRVAAALSVLENDLRGRTVEVEGLGEMSLPAAALAFEANGADAAAVGRMLESRYVKSWDFPLIREQIGKRRDRLRTLVSAP